VDLHEAVAALSDPDRRAEAARVIGESGDRSLLAPLVDAWDSRTEASIVPLAEAARALGGAEEALRLASSADPGQRYLAVRLIDLVGGDGELLTLERLAVDPDHDVASSARVALRESERTDAWHELVGRLKGSADPELSAEIESWLQAGSRGPGIFTAE
jgi:hypothetical protein